MWRAAFLAATVLGVLFLAPRIDENGFVWPSFGVVSAQTTDSTPIAPPAETFTPELPTPTPMDAAVESPTEPASDTATSLPTATETPTPASTPDPGATVDPSLTPEPTPAVDPSLPPLTEIKDQPGTVASATIGAKGGRIASADGRVAIDFPAGATSEDLNVSITKQDAGDSPVVAPEQPFVGVWRFDAAAPVQDGAAVHQFDADLTFTVRFLPGELAGLNPASLRFWTFDESVQRWVALPSAVNVVENMLVVKANHFSVDGATAARITDLGPLLDAKLTNLHSGSSSLSIPIAVPPGQGGLAPSLSLSYDSGRAAGMRQYTDVSSWVGHGWELSVGSVDVSGGNEVGCYSCFYGNGTYNRYFLNMANLGGEIIANRLRDNPYVRITQGGTSCTGDCFIVTDQSGTQYTFGGSTDSIRYYCESYTGGICRPFNYRYDLREIKDVLGNTIDITYQQFQQRIDLGGGDYEYWVASAYPQQITYGPNKIVFNLESDTTIGEYQLWDGALDMAARSDGPRKIGSGTYHGSFSPPTVFETHRLQSIDVRLWTGTASTLVRKYSFDYTTTPFDTDPLGCDSWFCPEGHHWGWRPSAGAVTLDSLTVTDTTGTNALYQMAFGYETKHWDFIGSGPEYYSSSFDRPLLTTATNGFGGSVKFEYSLKEKTTTEDHWTRQVVTKETHTGCAPGSVCASQPEVVTTYDYGPAGEGPVENPYVDLYAFADADYFHADYRGFPTVTETDSAGNQTVHEYFTTDPGGWQGTDWNQDVLTGREHTTTVKDAAGVQWKRVEIAWGVREVAWEQLCVPGVQCPPGYPAPDPSKYYINFSYVDSQTTTLKGGQQLKAVNTYDDGTDAATCRTSGTCYGLLTKVDDLGDPGDQGARVLTDTLWNKNTTTWVFTPKRVVTKKPDGTELSRTQFYYDGNQFYSPASPPAVGLLTATSTKLNASDFASTYTVHDQWGNQIQRSVPASGQPNQYSQGPALGWIPPGVAYSATTYDTVHHVYPLTQTAPIASLVTQYEYTDAINGDYLFGKPTKVTEPNGHWTRIRYDSFGRPIWAWDEFDQTGCSYTSCTYPTVSFAYNWGPTLPNSTLVSRRVESGTAKVRQSIMCMDGFGRTLATSEHFDANAANLVRIDYNDRGGQAAVTNPQSAGTGTVACPVSYPLIGTSADRTTYAYDPLGSVSTAMQVKAGETVGPHTTFIDDGTKTIAIDEMSRPTISERNVGAMTTTVTEPLAAKLLRPVSQSMSMWTATPGTTPSADHFLNLSETSPDDGDTVISSSTFDDMERYQFQGAGLASGPVYSVVFHYRWKQDVSPTSDPGTGVRPFYFQASGTTDGPLAHRTSADGWVDEYWELTQNPRTSSPWTLSDVNNGLQFGFKVGPAGSSPQVTQAWVEVVTQDPASAQTVYTSDLLGRLTNVRDAMNNQTTMVYDLASRKTSMIDPDMGTWNYAYNPDGTLTTQTDARNITTTLSYDAMSRLTAKDFSDTTPDVAYHYDTYEDTGVCNEAANTALGMLTRVTDGAGSDGGSPAKSALSCYDVRARVTRTKRYVDSTGYVTQFSNYDDLDRARTVLYPDGLDTVNYVSNNDQGFFTGMTSQVQGYGVQTLVSATTRTPWGATATLTLGNNLVTSYDFDDRLRVTNIQTGTSGVQDLEYTFDDASNVTAITDHSDSNSSNWENLTYTYDQLDRLTGMSINGTPSASYTYNQIGNILTKTEGSNALVYYYPNPGFTLPHAPAAITVNGIPVGFSYDNNGNAINLTGSTYSYDAENRMTARASGYTYTYDGGGGLRKRAKTDNSRVSYVGGIYERHQNGSGTVLWTYKYYSFGGQTVAMRKHAFGGAQGTVYYLLRDHLGSASTIVNASGAVVTTMKYWPFGMTRSGSTTVTDKLYTGQQQEPGDPLDLYHYGARVYSSLMGRFMSVDPIASGGPQMLNPYSYVGNNPMRYVDPTGMCVPGVNCPGDEEANQKEVEADPYYQQAAAEEWVNAPPMQPYDPCEACIAMQAAALAYQATAATERWVNSSSIAEGGGVDCGARCQAGVESRTVTSANESGGGCDWKCKAKGGLNAVGGVASDVGRIAVDLGDACVHNTECTGSIAIGIVIVGGLACPVTAGGGCLVAASALGTAVALTGDTVACTGGDNFACGMAVVDVATFNSGMLVRMGYRNPAGQVFVRSKMPRLVRENPYAAIAYPLGRAGRRAANFAWQHSDYSIGVPSLAWDYAN